MNDGPVGSVFLQRIVNHDQFLAGRGRLHIALACVLG